MFFFVARAAEKLEVIRSLSPEYWLVVDRSVCEMVQGKLSAVLSAILATITGTLMDGMYH